ncbi:DUF1592 domain-containing protein [Prosthecobacter sp.]|uniref:DUF1592 domain-containing protein n=1 Tax=Prosthecobacter sp. TaxID=1965333 RepID=UPI002AB99BCE|nr:DUF1592 domain-containing protein [Prosthecobacter sp.]MDZ4406006.1 DUF1592 domain-containing protein [Prosthecobacter sp.]
MKLSAQFLIVALSTHWVSADDFQKSILPVLKERCNTCHSTEKQKGDLDLERFTSLAEIKKEPMIWEGVLEQIEMGEMPPKKEKQLSAEQKTTLTNWARGTLDQIALANAGDPGPVVLRRLSNMEYTYTLRDLTGVDSLDPAKEFPVDGAAGEGFTNAGAALVMSPALLTKYLDAAKEIASHALLTPQGLHFSASTSSHDWTDETLAKIREFYARFTESGGATAVNLQGIKFDTNAGGRLPLAKYLAALQGKAGADGLNTHYLAVLKQALTDSKPSILLDPLRAKFREGKLTAADIELWQQTLWRFASVGHIGKQNGPKSWQEPVMPLVPRHEMRVKLASDRDLTLYLTTTDAGDGSTDDDVVWENPRLVAPGRPDLPISGLPALVKHLETQRSKIIASAEQCLNAIASGKDDADPALLPAWREYLGHGTAKLEPLLTKKLLSTPDYNFIQGWQGEQALSVLANSSDATVRIPGVMKAHSVATHPSPTRASVIAWRCEAAGTLRISGDVSDAHPECGNGVVWTLEVRRGHTSEVLAKGETKGANVLKIGPLEKVRVEPGQVLALVIGPRDGNHVCDLTAVNFTLNDGSKTWDLAKDVSPNILAGNPHGPWRFLSQPAALEALPDVPAPIAEWRKNPSPALAAKVRQHLEKDFPLNSPLLRPFLNDRPDRTDPTNLKAKAPSVLEVPIPAALANGTEFVVTGKLAAESTGSVQMQVLATKPESLQGIAAGRAESAQAKGQWSDNNLRTQHSAPVIVNDASSARKRFEAAFDEFRALFPIALCYTKIVPVDEVVTLTLFYREDEHLKHLMLDEAQSAEIDRLWDELRFVSEAPLKQVDVFEQLYQFATQDASPSAFEPMREPIQRGAETFKQQQLDAEPRHVQAALDFATQAWRRPLGDAEQHELRALYQKLRKQELPHTSAVRMLLTRVLVAPAFLYRGEKAAPGIKAAPVSDWEIATRLSYFLWSSTPDAELRQLAEAGKLREPAVLAAQARRMMKDARIRRLATEFGCMWLHVRDVETLDEKSERHFPTFLDLRDDMQEEAVRFFVDLFQADRNVLSLLDADHSFVNGPLAKHYALDLKTTDWQRVDGLRSKGRGGILGFAATLAKQAGASRTSPILRGTWLSEVILGDKLPIPPKGVPVLPEEASQGLTERQLTERHSRDERCAGCHKRIDPFGYALEGFDAIGRARKADTSTTLPDGTQVDGLADLRSYLLTTRRDDFLRQFCRKLLGYSLGRSVQLSDKPLIESMVKSDHRMGTLIKMVVRSPQFGEVRGRDFITSR